MVAELSGEDARLPHLVSPVPPLPHHSQQKSAPEQRAAVGALAWLSVQRVLLLCQTLVRRPPASEWVSHQNLREIQIVVKARAQQRCCQCHQQLLPYEEERRLLVGVVNQRC